MKRTCSLVFATVLVFAWAAVIKAADDGKALYASKCAMCHGQDGVPKKTGAGSKAFGDPEYKASASVASIVSATLEGKGKMKPVKSVTEDQAKLIAAHILTIGAAK
jgi:mono/diheme cytochrome c family protein